MPIKKPETFSRTASAPTSVPAPTSAAPTVSIDKVRLDVMIDELGLVLRGMFEETPGVMPDQVLCPAMVPHLAQIAKGLGVDYNPESSSTFKFVVLDDGSKYLNGPSLSRQGDSVVLQFAGVSVPINSEEPLYSTEWRMQVGSRTEDILSLFYKPNNFFLPVSLRLVKELDGLEVKPRSEQMRALLQQCNTFGDLLPLLSSGSPGISSLGDLPPGTVVTIVGTVAKMSKKGNEYIVGVVDTGKEYYQEFFLPKDVLRILENAGVSSVDIRVDSPAKGVVLIGGQEPVEFSLTPGFIKLAELPLGVYKVVEIFLRDNTAFEGQSAIMKVEIPGQGIKEVRGNAYCEDLVKKHGISSHISENSPGILRITGIREMKDGKKKVDLSLQSINDLKNPLMLNVMKQHVSGVSMNSSDAEIFSAGWKSSEAMVKIRNAETPEVNPF